MVAVCRPSQQLTTLLDVAGCPNTPAWNPGECEPVGHLLWNFSSPGLQHCPASHPVEDHLRPHYHPPCAAVPWLGPLTHPLPRHAALLLIAQLPSLALLP